MAAADSIDDRGIYIPLRPSARDLRLPTYLPRIRAMSYELNSCIQYDPRAREVVTSEQANLVH
jgi:hypothetical protein